MARKSASGPLRATLVVAGWLVAAGLVQGALGSDLEDGALPGQRGVQQQLQGAPPARPTPPARSHEEESIEPWELVGV